jgi:hypothetical protein
LVTKTVALWIAEPDLSVTTPIMAPNVDCPCRSATADERRIVTTVKAFILIGITSTSSKLANFWGDVEAIRIVIDKDETQKARHAEPVRRIASCRRSVRRYL